MKFRHRFRVRAGLESVAAFHRSASALAALTPPLTPMKILRAPEPLEPPCEMEMRLWLGPLPVRWKAALEALPEEGSPPSRGFVDRQVEGPFAAWRHEHRFVADGDQATWVIDSIEARLRRHPLWLLAGLSMWLGLHPLFLYRASRTKKLLEASVRSPEP